MDLRIRNANIKDSEAISELSGQLGYPSDRKEIKSRLSEILDKKGHCTLVALDRSKIVGWIHAFLSFRIESNSFVEIGGLVIDSGYQNMGIGTTLISEIQKWSQSIKCKKLRVRCNTNRTEVHGFYLNIGFEIKKEQKIFDKIL